MSNSVPSAPVESGTARQRSVFSARFMRSFSIGAKLWTTMLIMAVPVICLAYVYVHSLGATLWVTAAEQQGYVLFKPLDQLAQRVVRREELEATSLARKADSVRQIRDLNEEIDAKMAEFAALDTAQGNDATHALLQDLRSEWTAVKGATPATPQDSMASHEHLLGTLSALSLVVATDWKLTLDPETTAYNLIDVSISKIPDARRFLTEARAHMSAMYAGADYLPAEGAQVASLIALFNDRMATAREQLKIATSAASDRPTLVMQIGELGNDLESGIDAWSAQLARQLATGHPAEDEIRSLLTQSASFSQSLNSAQEGVVTTAGGVLSMRYSNERGRAIIALSGSGIAVIAALCLMWAVSRRVAGAIKRLIMITRAITQGRYDLPIDTQGSDEISRLFAEINETQRALAARAAAPSHPAAAVEMPRVAAGSDAERLGTALDCVSECLMVADTDGKIVYTNAAVDAMLRRAEGDIRKQLPAFSAAAVRGADFGIFHARPEHQRRMVAALEHAHTAQIKLGGRTFRLTVTPVVSKSGTRLGAAVEWIDRTMELDVEAEVNGMLGAVLEGDLSHRMETQGKTGFIEGLGRGMNRLVDNVQEIIVKGKGAVSAVNAAAQKISDGNAHLSGRIEQQSASLEQTAASMEQITATVKQNADNANQANQLASAAREQAQAGGAVVNQAITAMAEINESSKKIANIIGVIDEIAFQTNLLALNAAVEAARAGEQGRGFAVVASEVRSLAGRSAGAAKEIKELIRDSVDKVEGGTRLVSQSGKTLEQIVTAVKKVTDVVAEIASASGEQTRGIEQVNVAIGQMDGMTQQNTSLVADMHSASQAMALEVQELNRMLSSYRTAAGAGTGVGAVFGARVRGRMGAASP